MRHANSIPSLHTIKRIYTNNDNLDSSLFKRPNNSTNCVIIINLKVRN